MQLYNLLNTKLGYEIIKAGYQTAYKYNDGRLKIIYDTPMGNAYALDMYQPPVYYTIYQAALNFPVSFTEVPSLIANMSHADQGEPFMNVSIDSITKIGFGRLLFWGFHPDITLNVISRLRAEFCGYWKRTG